MPRRNNVIENLQQQRQNASFFVDQFDALSNRTLKLFNRVNERILDNKVAVDMLSMNVTEIGIESRQEFKLLNSKREDLELLIMMINGTINQSFLDIYHR